MNRPDQPYAQEAQGRAAPILIAARHLDHPEARMFAALARQGWRMEAVLHPDLRHSKILEDAGIPVHALDLGPRRLPRNTRSALADIMRRGRFGIVHTLHNGALRAAWRAAPVGSNASRWIAYRGAMNLTWSSLWLYRLIPVDAVVCVCGAVHDYLLRRGLPARMLRTIYKGHDPAWYPPAPRSALDKFHLPAGAVVFGGAASWRPSKGGALWVKSLQRLGPNVPAVALMLGDIRDRRLERLLRSADLKNRVAAPGARPDAAALLGACDVAVMPTRDREGLCKAVLEPMAQGIPAIVSDAGGLPEIVRDGTDGIVVPRGDAGALAAAMERMTRDADFRRTCGAHARERIRSVFHIQHTVAAYGALYEELLAHKK